DKTPMYMQNLRLLERLFPDALYVHLIRDGRDAATSFLAMPRGIVTETWMQPRPPVEFAWQRPRAVAAAQPRGRRSGAGRWGEATSQATDAAGRARLAWYDTRTLAWRGASFALRRSFLWRRRHPLLR